MPDPVSPVVPGLEPYEIVLAKNQPEYRPLPILVGRRPLYSAMARWQLTDEERRLIAEGADVYVSQMTFGHGYQPSLVTIAKATDMREVKDVIVEQFGYAEALSERI